MIEDRLWGLDRVPWCRPGTELQLIHSRLIAFDTGERIGTPASLLEAIERMPVRSLFFHVHERGGGRPAKRRLLALARAERRRAVAGRRLRAIDFHFLNLSQLRQALIEAFHHYVDEAPPIPRTAP